MAYNKQVEAEIIRSIHELRHCHTRYPDDKVFEDVAASLNVTPVMACVYGLRVGYPELHRAASLCLGGPSPEEVTHIASVVHHCETPCGKQPTAGLVEAVEVQREVQSEHYFSKPLSRLLLFRKMYT